MHVPRGQGLSVKTEPQVIPTQVAPDHTWRPPPAHRPHGRHAGSPVNQLPVQQGSGAKAGVQDAGHSAERLRPTGLWVKPARSPRTDCGTLGRSPAECVITCKGLTPTHGPERAPSGAAIKLTQQARVPGNLTKSPSLGANSPVCHPLTYRVVTAHVSSTRGEASGSSSLAQHRGAGKFCLHPEPRTCTLPDGGSGGAMLCLSPRSPTQVRGPLLTRATPLDTHPTHRDTRSQASHPERSVSQGKGSGHRDIKGKEGRKMMLTWGGLRVRGPPPHPKAAGK